MRLGDSVDLEAKINAAMHIIKQLDANDRKVGIALELLSECARICSEHNLGTTRKTQ